MAKTIETTDLTREAKEYQAGLRMLPYAVLGVILMTLKIRLLQVDGKDVIVSFLRKAGLWKPYAAGTIDYNAQLGKVEESVLDLKMGYAAVTESILNYRDKKILNTVGVAGKGYLASKEFPPEIKDLLTTQMVISLMEDMIPAIFFAERNTADKSPLGLFDGFFKKIDDQIVSTEISVANGNLIVTGPIEDPSTAGEETTAIKQLIAFVKALNPFLRANGIMYMSEGTFSKVLDSLDNLWINKDVQVANVLPYLNAKTNSNIQMIITTPFFGDGDRIMVTIEGNLDFGMNTFTDMEFVQFRQVNPDPNDVQMWTQAEFGTRIISTNKKVFAVNDEVNTAPTDLTGDY